MSEKFKPKMWCPPGRGGQPSLVVCWPPSRRSASWMASRPAPAAPAQPERLPQQLIHKTKPVFLHSRPFRQAGELSVQTPVHEPAEVLFILGPLIRHKGARFQPCAGVTVKQQQHAPSEPNGDGNARERASSVPRVLRGLAFA